MDPLKTILGWASLEFMGPRLEPLQETFSGHINVSSVLSMVWLLAMGGFFVLS